MTMPPEHPRDAGPERLTGSLADILAIIESAKARDGMKGLRRFVEQAIPEADPDEVRQAADVALEVIEAAPVFLVRARQEAGERGSEPHVLQVLERAERYYLKPIDLIPEMTQGLAGLLDDSYLVIRTLQHLDEGEGAFLDWDLDDPVRFLRRLMGPVISNRLDLVAAEAARDGTARLEELWDRTAYRA